MDLEKLKYPIGKFVYTDINAQSKKDAISTIITFPKTLRKVCEPLSEKQLNTPYRAEGWTIRQVVHHVADSHMNAYIRFKLSLTENTPIIKPYEEAEWAKGAEYKAPIELSLDLIDILHARWKIVLENMSDADFDKRYMHPETKKEAPLGQILLLYDWHSRHHLAHITNKIAKENW